MKHYQFMHKLIICDEQSNRLFTYDICHSDNWVDLLKESALQWIKDNAKVFSSWYLSNGHLNVWVKEK